MSELAVGKVFAGHRIEAVAGRGGMGVVYRARQLALERTVALKVISPALVEDRGMRERFLHESRAAASVEHANVVPVYYTGEEGGVAFVAMRYVPGEDLRSLLRAQGGLQPERAAGVVAQVAAALDAVHAGGLVHRDVKPGNVLLGPDGQVYLSDFGLAKHVLAVGGVTRTAQWVGSLDFAAPEQIRGQPVTAATDVYALGGVLYAALTGEAPYPRESEEAKLWAHLHAAPPNVSAKLPDAPPGLDAVVARAMAKDPGERYASAGELGRSALAAAAARVESPRRVAVAAVAPADASTVTSPAVVAGAAPTRRGVPAPPNRTIGRVEDVRALAARLRADSVRLLTLTGPGGVGKTRLALEVARALQADFADGAQFVSLAPLQMADEVGSAIVKALAIVVLPGESPSDALERFLAFKRLLLVVDNFEHLLEAAPLIGDLVGTCPTLTVLATSRSPLMLQAEECHPVAPLALPAVGLSADAATLAGADAVALFTERARARDPAFDRADRGNAAAVAEICRRVDGLPLAIELAAGRCGLLSPREIAQRMDGALAGLGTAARDMPARQRTLHATINWSHQLLGEAERTAFARFAAFAGGATIEATETITGADLETLDALVAKSLLMRRQHADALTRLDMLETIRAYAAERLAGVTDQQAVRERHYRYYLTLAQRHGAARALEGPGHRKHLARLDAEIDNLHAALRWAVGEAGTKPALALAVALGRYWTRRGRHAEAVTWIDNALALPGAHAHPELQVRALCFKVSSMRWMGRAADQPAVLDEAEAIARRIGDPLVLSQALQTRATLEAVAGHPDVADPIADEAIRWATTAGDKWEIASSWNAKAKAAATAAELRQRVERAASLLLEVGNLHELGDLFGSAAYTALFVGSDRDAKEFLDREIPFVRELDDPYSWMVHQGNFGLAAMFTGDTTSARDAFREELTLCRALAVRFIACEGLIGLAAVAAAGGDVHRAARLVGAASAHRYGAQQDVIEKRLDQAFFRAARGRCGANAWDAAVYEGAALSFEDAIAYALDEGERKHRPSTSDP